MITIGKYTPEPSLNDKYFYVKTQEKLFNVLNSKKQIRIPNLQNQKKTMALVE